MKVAKIAFVLALCGFLLAAQGDSQTVNQTTRATLQAGGEAVNGLQMSISHDNAATDSDKGMHLTVTFRNLSTEEVTFTPGTLVDCGRSGSKISFIELNLTDPDGRPHRHLPYLGDGPPYAGSCGGQIIPFVAALGPGASMSLALDLCKYFDLSDSKKYVEARFSTGTYLVQAELTGPLFQNVVPIETWTATVTSNISQVRFGKEFAAPLDNYASPLVFPPRLP